MAAAAAAAAAGSRFWRTLSACVLLFLNPGCRTCKFFHAVSPTKAKCRHFIRLNGDPFVVLDDASGTVAETEIMVDVDAARCDLGLCGPNATFYRCRML